MDEAAILNNNDFLMRSCDYIVMVKYGGPLDCLETKGPHVKYYNSIDYATDPGEPIFINSDLIFVNPCYFKCGEYSVLLWELSVCVFVVVLGGLMVNS